MVSLNGLGLARCFHLPGRSICKGDIVTIIDSRARAYNGVFYGYESGFIAIVASCEDLKNAPLMFINVKRISQIIVRGKCKGYGSNEEPINSELIENG